MLGFKEICSVTAALPLITMFACFVSAVVFQFDDVHETHCRVCIQERKKMKNEKMKIWKIFRLVQ